MKERILGIDIGISSIGWAVVEKEENLANPNEEILEIIDSGVRIFTKAENPKTKESLALPRRLARSARRRTRRRRERMKQIKLYLSKALNIPLSQMEQGEQIAPLFRSDKNFISPWELRAKALHLSLSNEELARVILHIAKSRGYDDITYGVEDSDKGKITKAIKDNQALCQKENCKTIGEMMYKTYFQKPREGAKPQQWLNVRNKNGEYQRCVGRSELRAELEMIFDSQKSSNPALTQEFYHTLLGNPQGKTKHQQEGIIFYQRPLKSFEGKIGKCQFFKDKDRACKSSPSAEEFIALTKIINTLMNLKNQFGVCEEIAPMIETLLTQARQTKAGLTYAKLKSILNLPESFEFQGLDYSKEKIESKTTFISLPSTYALYKANPTLPQATQDKIAEILGANKDWQIIENRLKAIQLSQEAIENIKDAKLSFSKHINLSLEALGSILPLMKKGKRYDEAIEELYTQGIFKRPSIQATQYLPPLSELAKEDSYFDIPNPVVNRALSEFRKVVNALIDKYGGFHFFNLELARDVGRSKEERSREEKRQKDNQAINKRAEDLAKELNLSPTRKNILKCKLWMLQGEYCVYTGEKIKLQDLQDEMKLDIDHILPLSRSLDDSQSNKILCFKSANQEKRNRTPFEWLGSNPQEWDQFFNRICATSLSVPTRKKLLLKNFKERKEGERGDFLARNLVDTGYIARVVSKYIKTYLKPLPLQEDKPNRLRIISGSLTSALRAYWGLIEKDREHHLHHAQDAIIIACITQSAIQKYSSYLKDKELGYKNSKEKSQEISQADYATTLALRRPTKDFKNHVQQSIEKIFVSHRSSHKVSGALHLETIRSKESYYSTYGGEIGVEKALSYGKIRKVKSGYVDNGEMVRVDIFKSKDKGKFFAVPIYTFDFATGILPNKAIVSGKSEGVLKDWIEMDENYEFCFSLFRNDYISIQTSKMSSPITVLYKGTDSGTGSLSFEHHSRYAISSENEKIFFKIKDNDPQYKTTQGIQNLKVFQKVQVSPLGEIKPIKPSKRQGLDNKSSKKKNV